MEVTKIDLETQVSTNQRERVKSIISIIVFIISVIVILGIIAINIILIYNEYVNGLDMVFIIFFLILTYGDLLIAILFRMSIGIEHKTLAKILSIINIIASLSIIITWIVLIFVTDPGDYYIIVNPAMIGSYISLPINIILLVRNQTLAEYSGFSKKDERNNQKRFKKTKSIINIVFIVSLFFIFIFPNNLLYSILETFLSTETATTTITIMRYTLFIAFFVWFITSEIVYSIRKNILSKEIAIK